MESGELDSLLDELRAIEERLGDMILDALRTQSRSEDSTAALNLEKRLSRARRSIVKARATLNGASDD